MWWMDFCLTPVTVTEGSEKGPFSEPCGCVSPPEPPSPRTPTRPRPPSSTQDYAGRYLVGVLASLAAADRIRPAAMHGLRQSCRPVASLLVSPQLEAEHVKSFGEVGVVWRNDVSFHGIERGLGLRSWLEDCPVDELVAEPGQVPYTGERAVCCSPLVDKARHSLRECSRSTKPNRGAIDLCKPVVDCAARESCTQRRQRAGISHVGKVTRDDCLTARPSSQPTLRYDTNWRAIILAIDFCQPCDNCEVGPKASEGLDEGTDALRAGVKDAVIP
jgi:hypothetical protein